MIVQKFPGVKVAFIGFGEVPSSSSLKLMDYALNTFGLTASCDPDIIFVREDLYAIREMLTNYSPNATRILFSGEMQGANFDLFDYVIGWELGDFGGRYVRMHPALREWKTLQLATSFTPATPFEDRYFCDFIFSNSRHFGPRDEFFATLNRLKGVDSLGPHLRNVQSREGLRPFGPGWELEKIKTQSHYKFSISIENGIYNGYTTEKIMTSVIAGSIPIYWGNPQVGLDFNAERLINLDKFRSLEAAARHVVALSENQTELERITNLPLMTEEQLIRVQENESEILSLLQKAIESALSGTLCRPRGTSVAQREVLLINSLRMDYKLRKLREFHTRVFLKVRPNIPRGLRQFIHAAIRIGK